MKKRTSPIWKMPSSEFSTLVKISDSFSGILRHWGMENKGSNGRTLKERIEYEGLSVSHIYENHRIGKPQIDSATPLDEIMVEDSTYSRGCLKRRLLKVGMLKDKCVICGQENSWNDNKLVLVLDHINGKSNDHRLENLRLLCPNCNSQQDTFAGRKNKKPPTKCPQCDGAMQRKSKLCIYCSNRKAKPERRKVKSRPSKELLEAQVKETSYCAVGRKYGVSDNAIRKWIKS